MRSSRRYGTRSLLIAMVAIASAAAQARPAAGEAARPLPPPGGALVPNDGGAMAVRPPPETGGGPAASPRTSAEVLQAVESLPGLASWTVVPFAHFRRGDHHVVVAWPALNSAGQLVDATVVGVCLVETATGALEECCRRWVVRDAETARASLVQALGGDDYEVLDRVDGFPLDELGPRLSRLGSAFVAAMDAGDRAGARQAAAQFANMLPLDRVSLENGAAQLLWAAATHHGRLEHVDTLRQGDTAAITFNVLRGRQRFRTIQALARQVAGRPDVWVLESYQ
jgi:hypothetical protein